METHGVQVDYDYDRAKQAARLVGDRAEVLRQAIMACRKGRTVSIVAVYAGVVDKIPMGAAMKTRRSRRAWGRCTGRRYVPRLLRHIERGELDPSFLLTHPMSLDDGQRG